MHSRVDTQKEIAKSGYMANEERRQAALKQIREDLAMTEGEIGERILGHVARNSEIDRHLRKKGVELDQERSIEHHFWAKAHMDGVMLAKELYGRGYLVLVISPTRKEDGSVSWNVEASLNRTISEAIALDTTEALVRLAATFRCIYDGGGTSV